MPGRSRQRKSSRPRSYRQLAYLPPTLPSSWPPTLPPTLPPTYPPTLSQAVAHNNKWLPGLVQWMILQNRTNSIDTFKIFICKPPIFLWNHLHSSIHLISCCIHATFSFSIQHDMHIMQQQSHDKFIFFPLHSCHWDIFAIGTFSPSGFFAIGISSCDSHRPSPLSAHWQLLRRLITDLPLVTRSARARPAYQQPRHNRPTSLYT